MIIKGPAGQPLEVTSEGRGKTSAASESLAFHENHRTGAVWSTSFSSIDPVGAGDYFYYLKNNSSTDIAVTDFKLYCSTTVGVVSINVVSGTPTFTAGVDLAPVGHHLGKSPTLDATVKSDTDTTGLTDGGLISTIVLDTLDKQVAFRPGSAVIIPQGKAIAMSWSAATGSVSGTVTVMEIPAPDDL